MPASITLRIVVLRVDKQMPCTVCGLPAAVQISYALEEGTRAIPDSLHVVTYCEMCEPSG